MIRAVALCAVARVCTHNGAVAHYFFPTARHCADFLSSHQDKDESHSVARDAKSERLAIDS